MKYLKYALFFLLPVCLFSCKEDFDVQAPYKSIPVVYSVLNSNDSVHYVRISKTFMGEGNNFEYAKIADSSFAEVTNTFVDLISGNNVIASHALQMVNLPEKEDGEFFTQPNTAYAFTDNNIARASKYRLRFTFEGRNVSSEVRRIAAPTSNSLQGISSFSFVINNTSDGSEANFSKLRINFSSAIGTRVYRAFFKFNYLETYTDGSTSEKSVSHAISSAFIDNITTVKTLDMSVNSEGVFNLFMNNIPENPDVVKREILPCEASISGIGENLYVYEQANSSGVGLGQEVINFTNVFFENGDPCIGVFEASNTSVTTLPLSVRTKIYVIQNELGSALKFCSNDQDVINEAPNTACQ